MPQFRNVVTFLIFVAVSGLFWAILALNDSVTETFRVKIVLNNVPDTVTFINDPPVDMHVTMRDKGTRLLRSGIVKNPSVEINFLDYARDGIFRMTRNDLMSAMKASFGSGLQISSMSLDSLRIYYSDQPGRRVPVQVRVDATASSGNIIAGSAEPVQKSVLVYSYGNEVDTVNYVTTQKLMKRDLKQTSVFEVKLQPLRNVKIVPPVVQVKVPVEPLVHKEGYAVVTARNVPPGLSLLLFPSRVPVSYYVPMSLFNDTQMALTVVVDYNGTHRKGTNKLALEMGAYPDYIVNPEVAIDSVEYTLLRK